jgi:DNA-binding SARP family transcriptional activator
MSELLTLGRVRLVAADGTESVPGAAQPKRLALLAYLALTARDTPVRRDALLALFWPELGEDEGRPALRQALYHLRRVVGDDVFETSGDELSLREGALRCDAAELERLVRDGQFNDALTLYRGDFFDGFHVDDVAPELEEWISRTRARLRRRASSAAWSQAEEALTAGDTGRATELARRACELDADQEAGWRRLMTLQADAGDRIGALRTYEELAARLERDLDAKPDADTTALANRIRTTERTPAREVLPTALATSASTAAAAQVDVPPAVAAATPKRGSWRETVVAGLVGAAVIIGGLGAYRRWSNADEGPSLIAAGSLVLRDRVVVAEFANLAGDSALAAGITEAFRVDLTQSPNVRVLSGQQVAGALERMQRARDTALTEELARELAVREGAKAIVMGSLVNAAGAFTVTVKLEGTERGDVLAAFRETASDSSELLAAVDRASKKLRNRLGESMRSLRALPPLTKETTGSLAALRKHTEARRLAYAGRRTEAIRAYEQAVAIDTAFAGAYIGLAMVYGSDAEPGRAAAYLQRALAHRDRLPFFDRLFHSASAAYGRQDYDGAADAYTRLIERYPNDIRLLNNLALVYRDRHRYATAESLFTRAAAIDSMVPGLYFGIHSTQLLQGNFRGSRTTLDLIGRRFPGNPVLQTVEIQDAAAQQHWENAERQAETKIAAVRGDTLQLVDPYEALAGIAMLQGRLAEAERYWRTHLMVSKASDSDGRHLFGVLQLARLQLRYRNAPARALAIVDSALAATPLDSILPGDRPYDDLARFYASAGHLTTARELLARAAVNDTVLGLTPGPDRAWTRAVIALAEGRTAAAESELRQAADGLVCPVCALPDLARAYEATGKSGAAIAVYERYVSTPWLWRYEPDAAELGWAMKRLAELYDARGETGKAAAMRGRLLQLWRRADPELQPVIADLRSRVAG